MAEQGGLTPGRGDPTTSPEERRYDDREYEEDLLDHTASAAAGVARLEDRWRRTAAELDNLRKRVARDTERQRWDERGRVTAAWLPVVDNLDLALRHADADPDSVVQGVRAVREQALTVLAGLGFPRRDDVGAKFDPARHEAVSTTADVEAEPGTVVAVLRPGYGEGERQLRAAAVVVAARPEHGEAAGGEASDGKHGG
ncbi:nucleotide exchange factor GrpE [Saccharothrix sp. ALI-22-I]|uniref:nucleotide exchange factor GrpE n=1 Tax=Saccharothrix sp. ALI-22-I TaxID=1933778 RepID=UPI00097CA801|nr:nucleotide exchange factor GrpE [Saccharothrix sp. ALI-22-I]ONI87667.1 nucleotide exchange factor GrpE [Saccharothrix sp. ALI-22-I]